MDTELSQIPRNLLEKALKLRNAQRHIFITLCYFHEPQEAKIIAQKLGLARAYVNMRLNELVDQKMVTFIRKGKKKLFQVIR